MPYADNLPQQEKDRLDMMHHLVTIRLDGKLHLAPIGKNPHRILDLGTGTGIWAIEMGEFCMRAKSMLHTIYFLLLLGADFTDRGCLSFCGSMSISSVVELSSVRRLIEPVVTFVLLIDPGQ
jgi:hypothetical protein